LEVRVEVKASVVSPLRLHFDSGVAFEQWLQASGLTLDEFETLPIYDWYREELEPLVRASREARPALTAPGPPEAPRHRSRLLAQFPSA
jgi:hypothetical protein